MKEQGKTIGEWIVTEIATNQHVTFTLTNGGSYTLWRPGQTYPVLTLGSVTAEPDNRRAIELAEQYLRKQYVGSRYTVARTVALVN